MGNSYCCMQERQKSSNDFENKLKQQEGNNSSQSNLIKIIKNSSNIEEIYKLSKFNQKKHIYTNAFLAENIQNKKIFIAKQISKRESLGKMWESVDILLKCDNANVLKPIEYFDNQADVILILDYHSGITLYDEIQRRQKENLEFQIEELRQVAFQLLQVVRYIHRINQIFDYLAPQYIVLEEKGKVENLKISFYEQVKIKKVQFEDQDQTTRVIDLHDWQAPELKLYKEKASYSADIWSIGVILFTMVFKKHPL